ncbi:response regulator transcription factor [Kineothrix sp. MB12-C1]|uniref:response regulator transcription factor n=1 Tax=Kineothrix sp. MB12-C1 TaxID=3070215 RepID=UPI0027D2AB1C|nr:response regulator transcription factor [Kineothrix sp. MB12-C1]WMC92377.1 response regulator transcription factor [Kineothrix sp. MB12-C1]
MPNVSKNILAVDDEPKIQEVVSALLESKGFRVFTAESGQKALEIFRVENISLVILDLMLPDISGEEVCREIRKKSRVPILMLTAKSEENDLLYGLGIGADDYIIKPFSLKELYARIEAILRRTQNDLVPLNVRNSFGGGDLVVDFEQNFFQKTGQPVSLTPNEIKILSALIKYPGKVFTREELITIALGSEFEGYDRAIDSHVKNLRQKIEDDPKKPVYILTVHGIGYKFNGK